MRKAIVGEFVAGDQRPDRDAEASFNKALVDGNERARLFGRALRIGT
jgi:hypothetical protein